MDSVISIKVTVKFCSLLISLRLLSCYLISLCWVLLIGLQIRQLVITISCSKFVFLRFVFRLKLSYLCIHFIQSFSSWLLMPCDLLMFTESASPSTVSVMCIFPLLLTPCDILVFTESASPSTASVMSNYNVCIVFRGLLSTVSAGIAPWLPSSI